MLMVVRSPHFRCSNVQRTSWIYQSCSLVVWDLFLQMFLFLPLQLLQVNLTVVRSHMRSPLEVYPSGLSLNSSNGAITGTPSGVASSTTSSFTITATDDESQTATRDYSITVTPNYIPSTSVSIS